MAIPAKRFDFLDQETNVSVSSFSSKLDSGILNQAFQDASELSAGLENLIDSSLSVTGLDGIVASVSEATERITTGASINLKDLQNLPQEKLDEVIKALGGESGTVGKSLKALLKKCSGSNKGMGAKLPGKPYDTSINCGNGEVSLGQNGKSSGCDAGSFGNVLSALTGGDYNAKYKDLNALLGQVLALSTYGMNLGLCGVFGALAKDLPKDALSKVSGSLLDYAGISGNVNGFLDVAKSSVALAPLVHAPAAVSKIVSNFTLPTQTKVVDFPALADRFMGGLELVKEDWAQSQYDKMLSMAVAEKHQPELASVFSSKLKNRGFTVDELDVPLYNDEIFLLSSYVAQTA